MIVGTHYSIDFIEIERLNILDDADTLMAYLRETIQISGLEAIGDPLIHQFQPQGITCLILLAQSHLAIHTWPEHHFMAVDFFTCGPQEEGRIAYESLKRAIPCQHVIEHTFTRQTTP